MLVVDVSGNEGVAKVVRAIAAVHDAAEAVRDCGSGLDYSRPIRGVGEELAWHLVYLTGHADVGGNGIVYRAGRVGVAVAVTQEVRAMRHVERRIRYEVVIKD